MDARNTQDYSLDPKVLFLPTLRGFGTLPDLHISMSADKKLLSMMETFASKLDFAGLFQDFAAVENEVKAMLFQWAGVPAKPAPTLAEQGYAGVFAFMPEYHFLKKFMGLDNDVVGMWFDERPFAPGPWQGIEAVTESFNIVLQNPSSNTGFAEGDTYYSVENIRGSKYSDNLRGDNSNNSIWGNNGNDIIEGRGGKDTLYGQNGNDLLFGGGGNDTLYGGSGADIFYFRKGESGIDEIMDFKKAEGDKIDTSSLLDAYDPLSDAITHFVQITTSGSNSILKVDMNGGGDSFVQIATIQNVVGLTDEAALVRSGHLIV